MSSGPWPENCLLFTVHLSCTSRDMHSMPAGCRVCPNISCMGCSGSVLVFKSVNWSAKNLHHKTVIRRQDKQHQHCTILKPIYYCYQLTFTIIYLLGVREWSVGFFKFFCYTWLQLLWCIFNLPNKTWFLIIIPSLLLLFFYYLCLDLSYYSHSKHALENPNALTVKVETGGS